MKFASDSNIGWMTGLAAQPLLRFPLQSLGIMKSDSQGPLRYDCIWLMEVEFITDNISRMFRLIATVIIKIMKITSTEV